MEQKHRILIVGDSPFLHTGFAYLTRELGFIFHKNGYDVEHIGMWDQRKNQAEKTYNNITIPWKVHIANGDFNKYSATHYRKIIQEYQPTLIIIITDIWLAKFFMNTSIQKIFYFHVEGAPLPINQTMGNGTKLNWPETLLKNLIVFGGPFGKKVTMDRITQYVKDMGLNIDTNELDKKWPIIGDGIDTEIFKPIEGDKHPLKLKHFGLKGSDMVIGFFSRQSSRKGLPYALEAFAEWENRPDNVYIYCHCALHDRAGWDLIQMVKDLKIEKNVLFLDEKYNVGKGVDFKTLNELYNSCDLIVSPSLGEGFGQTTCCVPETAVKMKYGYKYIKDIKPGDTVGVHNGKFEKVLDVFETEYDGSVYEMKTNVGPSFKVTVGHKIYTKTENKKYPHWIRSHFIKEGNMMVYPTFHSNKAETLESLKNEILDKGYVISKNELLIYELRDLLLSSNFPPDMVIRKFRNRWQLTIVDTDIEKFESRSYDNRRIKKHNIPITKVKKSKYKGKVYNLNVENTHSYLVNSVASVHNCQALSTNIPVIITDYSELSNFTTGVYKVKPIAFSVEPQTNIRRAIPSVDAIRKYFIDLYDKFSRNHLKIDSRESIMQYTWSNIAPKWLDLVESIPLYHIKKETEIKKIEKLVSIILPTYNSNPKILTEAIESVKNQTYKNIELIIVDDGSDKRDHIEIIEKYRQDENINVRYFETKENRGISASTTSGINMVHGDYVGFLDHDDMLKPTCIEETVTYLEIFKDKNMVYTDEDFINIDGSRIHAIYKEDYNAEFILATMYINHFRLYRSDKLTEFLPLQYDGAQDYDLTLKFTERYEIGHIKKILYSWRKSKTSSTNIGIAEKTANNNKSAVKDALKRRNINAEVKIGPMPTQWYIDRKLKCRDLVSIIILTKDKPCLIEGCINSIEKHTKYPYEIIIVDTGSTNPQVLNYYKTLKYKVVFDRFHFSRSNNNAAKIAKGKYLCFLNNDTVATDGWLTELMKLGQEKHVGLVGPKLLYPNDNIQHAGVALGISGLAGHMYHNLPQHYWPTIFTREVSAVTGACMLIRKSLFESVGGFDEKYMIEFQDIDLCLKLKQKSYKILYTPRSILYHFCSVTRGKVSKEEAINDRSLFVDKWEKELAIPDQNLTSIMIDHTNLEHIKYWKAVANKIKSNRRQK